MTDYVHLIGAEQVQSAGISMRQAADTMRSAAGEIDHSIRMFQTHTDGALSALELILAENRKELKTIIDDAVREVRAIVSRGAP